MLELTPRDLAATISNDAQSFLAVIDHVSPADPEFPGFIIMLTGRITDNIVTLLARENGETDMRVSPQKALTARYIGSSAREPLGVLIRNKSLAGGGQRPAASVLPEHIRAFGKFTQWFGQNSDTLAQLKSEGKSVPDLERVCKVLEEKAGISRPEPKKASPAPPSEDKLDRLISAVERTNTLLEEILKRLPYKG